MARYFAPITIDELKAKVEKAFVKNPKNPYPTFSQQVMLKKLGKDLKVSFDCENFGMTGNGQILGYHTLPNGLTFLGCLAGGDWEYPVTFIVYWDGKRLRGYVPMNGNPWNTDTKEAFGNNKNADLKNARKRWPDCPLDDSLLFSNFDSNDAEMLKDIESRILPVNFKKTALKSLPNRANELVYYGDCDEGTELFVATLQLCYKMYGLNDNNKAEILYEWAKEQADISKEWAEAECKQYGTDLKDQPTLTKYWGC